MQQCKNNLLPLLNSHFVQKNRPTSFQIKNEVSLSYMNYKVFLKEC